jgi:hypothetical protein
MIKKMVVDIQDPRDKVELEKHLKQVADSPNDIDLLEKEAHLELEIVKEKEKKSVVPIWTIVAVVGIVAAGTLAYRNRHSLKLAWNVAAKTKGTHIGTKTKIFFSTLFDKQLNRENKSFINSSKAVKEFATAAAAHARAEREANAQGQTARVFAEESSKFIGDRITEIRNKYGK